MSRVCLFPFVFKKVRVISSDSDEEVEYDWTNKSGERCRCRSWKVIKIQQVILVLLLKGPGARSTGRLRARLQSHRPQGEVESPPPVRAQRRRCKLTWPSPIKHHWLIPSKLLNLPKHQSNMYFVTMLRPFLLLDCFVSKKGQDQQVQ